MLEPNDLPLVCLPVGLSDEAAAQLLEFLQALAEAVERHYAGQLQRHYRATHPLQDDLVSAPPPPPAPPLDPPF